MEKILATLYLIGVFFTTFVLISFYISDVIGKWKNRKSIVENQNEPISETEYDVVGKSTSVFLSPLRFEKNEPMMSEKLELEPAAEVEPDISPDEVEVKTNNSYIPDDDELEQYANDDVDTSGDFSQGLTYQQISHAIDVVEGKKSGENDELLAGETLSVMPSDFLNLICRQADHESNVKKLLASYVDSVGKIKPKPVTVSNFNINKYV